MLHSIPKTHGAALQLRGVGVRGFANETLGVYVDLWISLVHVLSNKFHARTLVRLKKQLYFRPQKQVSLLYLRMSCQTATVESRFNEVPRGRPRKLVRYIEGSLYRSSAAYILL